MPATVQRELRGGRGGTIRLGAQLGDPGAAGTVYEDRGDPASVIKLLHEKELTPETRRRLEAMVARAVPPSDRDHPGTLVAWPTELVLERGAVCGVRIPKATGPRAKILYSFASGAARERQGIDVQWRTLAWTAHNVALVVQRLHDLDIVVADVNESNFMANASGAVTIIDADSMSFVDAHGFRHATPYRKPEFVAPELIGAPLSSLLRRTRRHDEHALAVVLFMVLMNGFHPFDGVTAVAGERQSDRTRTGRFGYPLTTHGLQPPPNAPPWDVLPAVVQREFVRTFTLGAMGRGERTSALRWTQVLRSALLELRTCELRGHDYPAALAHCPWCTHEGLPSRRFVRPAPAPRRPAPVASSSAQRTVPRPLRARKTLRSRVAGAAGSHPFVATLVALLPAALLWFALASGGTTPGAPAGGGGAATSTPVAAGGNAGTSAGAAEKKPQTSRKSATSAAAKARARKKAKARAAARARAKRAAAAAKARRQRAAAKPRATATPKPSTPKASTPSPSVVKSPPARSGGGSGLSGQAKPGSKGGSGGLTGSAGGGGGGGLSGSAGSGGG